MRRGRRTLREGERVWGSERAEREREGGGWIKWRDCMGRTDRRWGERETGEFEFEELMDS